MKNLKDFTPKLIDELKNYNVKRLGKDVVAGIIVAIIALPLSIALALASGVTPEQGIYTAIFAGFVVSAFGGSRVQISGPTAAFATIVAGIVMREGIGGLAIATIMAGIILVVMGLFRFGTLIKFIPQTTVIGFTSGIAVTIFIGQIKDFLGLTFTSSPIETLEKLSQVINCFNTINFSALLVGAISLAVLIVLPMITNKIPPSLIAIFVGIAVVNIFKLDVNTIGSLYTISNKLPTPALPSLDFETIRTLFPDAFTIAVLCAIESLLSSVVSDGMIGDKHKPNAELIGQGLGNIVSAIFGGIPATGAIARTTANIKNGSTSPISGMVHSVVLLLVLIILMPYTALIPMPTIAAILFMVAYNMSSWREFVALFKKSPKSDVLVLLITFVLTVAFDLVIAIEIGLLLSAILLIKRMTDVSSINEWSYDLTQNLDFKEVPKGTVVYEIMGSMFFAMSENIYSICKDEKAKVVILRMRDVPSIDASALNALEQLYNRCNKKGIKMILAHTQKQPLSALKKSGLENLIGKENICSNISKALVRAEELTN